MNALAAGEAIRAFYDMMLAPVPIDLVGAAIVALMSNRARGIFHLTGPSDVTYGNVVRFVVNRVGADPGLVRETSAREAGLPEGTTPRHTTLDSSALKSVTAFWFRSRGPWSNKSCDSRLENYGRGPRR